jgi:Tfp pilus assembly protein PilW
MKSKQYSPSYGSSMRRNTKQRGYTLVEFLIASSLSLALGGMLLASLSANRRLYKYDLVRTRVSQNLRSAIEIIGLDVRQAGENLPPLFPAIEIVDGAAGAPDELIVRRNLLDESIRICTQLDSGAPTNILNFGDTSGTLAGCDYSSLADTFASWQAYRAAAPGNEVPAYIYDAALLRGEHFTFAGENDSGSQFTISADDASWGAEYGSVAAGSPLASAYVIEEWRYRLNGDVLELIINDDTSSPLNVVFDVTDFQVSATLVDGSTQTSYGVGQDWTLIEALQVSLTGQSTAIGNQIQKTISSSFFPRNVLSN